MKNIKEEPKNITTKLGITDRVHVIWCKQALITIKGHKEEFPNNPSFRLNDPTKSELGWTSQEISKIYTTHKELSLKPINGKKHVSAFLGCTKSTIMIKMYL